MNVLGIIPARGGSKGIFRKNLVDVCGRPLIAYTFDSAKAAKKLSNIVLSTDDEEIAELGRQHGIEVPYIRPSNLAEDHTPTIDVVVDICEWMIVNRRTYDCVCLLQPTSPIRPKNLIDDCIREFEHSEADSLVTVCRVPHVYNPKWVYLQDDAGRLELVGGGVEPPTRRQLLPPAFIRDGSIYLSKMDILVQKRSLFGTKLVGFHVEPGINIDTTEDLHAFRTMIEQQSNPNSSDRSNQFKK